MKIILNFTTSIIIIILFLLSSLNGYAQDEYARPHWWFGAGLGANYNIYGLELKKLNDSYSSPEAFTKGSGFGIFGAALIEYRPTIMWGGFLNLGFDGRSGKISDIDVAGKYKISPAINYISLEPNLRFNPAGEGFFLFLGPKLNFNITKSFDYETPTEKISGDFSNVRSTNFGGQIGLGYDLPLTSQEKNLQIVLAPTLGLHFGQGVRDIEKWNLTTVRFGIQLKFGSTPIQKEVLKQEVDFSIQSPQIIPGTRRVSETFPLRNYIFFDQNSTKIPSRYIQLSPEQADKFKEENLFEPKLQQLSGRSARQMEVYYNILNIIGDRMRRYPDAMISLIGASKQGKDTGKEMANSVREYLVNVFGINPARILTFGVEKPEIPSYQPGGTRELSLVMEEDNRVDIKSGNLDLLLPVKIIAIQEDPIDADVVFQVNDSKNILSSWTLQITDAKGTTKTFGPFITKQERISGNQILGKEEIGDYQIVMIGKTKDGSTITKEQKLRLAKAEGPEEQPGLRYSILFEFDQSKTVATYEKFLSEVVVPTIPEGASVVIHGHTDIVGEESHNLTLSNNRAQETMNVIQRELNKAGKKYVRFDTYGFGEDPRRAPFENRLPEERFYNRTVIIDIIP